MRFATLVISILVSVSLKANAGLISSVGIESESRVEISWIWDGTVPSLDAPTLTNWDGEISLSLDPSDSTFGTLLGRFFFVERIEPRTISLGPVLIFDNESSSGVLLDLSFKAGPTEYHFFFDRAVDPSESIIRASAARVPLPSSLLLLFPIVLLLVIQKKRWHVTNKGCGRRTGARNFKR